MVTVAFNDRTDMVVYTPRGERTRIISARKAERKERKVYYDNI